MTTISSLALRYALFLLALGGVVACVRVLIVGISDLRALEAAGANGGKRIWVHGRLVQSAFLLAAFAVLLAMGAVIALAPDYEITDPLTLTLVVSCNAVSLVLMLKEITIRRTRTKLDTYYDASRVHTHSRASDLTVAQVAQEAASNAQATATIAQNAASAAQANATSAQDVATIANQEEIKGSDL